MKKVERAGAERKAVKKNIELSLVKHGRGGARQVRAARRKAGLCNNGPAHGAARGERARQGAFSGTIKLSPAQLSALNRQSLYVRIDNEKSPDGNLQGWLKESGKDQSGSSSF